MKISLALWLSLWLVPAPLLAVERPSAVTSESEHYRDYQDKVVYETLQSLESQPSYQSAIRKQYQKLASCRDWILLRELDLEPYTRSITSLCHIERDIWEISTLRIGSGSSTSKKIRPNLDAVMAELAQPTLVGDAGFVWTDGSFAFITMSKESALYRHAVICPNCADIQDGSANTYAMLSRLVREIDCLVSDASPGKETNN